MNETTDIKPVNSEKAISTEIQTIYKDSPLGKIPVDWDVKRISDFGKVITGNTPPTNDVNNYGEEYMFVSPGDLSDRKYILQTEKGLSKKGFDLSRKFPEGSILFTCIGSTIGKSGIATKDLTSNQQINAIIVHSKNSNEFLYYQLERNATKIKLIAGEQAVPIINKSQFEAIKLICPPIPEQRAIAHCLSTIDETITKTNQLIAQKELRKKWLMQQLLTGKKRLNLDFPDSGIKGLDVAQKSSKSFNHENQGADNGKRIKGFGGEWKEIHIRDITKEVSLRNNTDKQLTVLSCTKYNGLVPSLEYFGRKIFSDDISTYKIVPKNHFAYATNHIEEGSIGYQDSFEEALISPMYTVFKTDNSVNDYFFFKLLKSHRLIFEYNARMEGSIDRRGGLRWDSFSIIKVTIPSLEEQTAIAQVLQAADKEIQLLKAKVEKLKEEKKGMMQLLLTGKKRLNY